MTKNQRRPTPSGWQLDLVIPLLGLGIVSIHTLELELETGRLDILDVQEFPIIRHWYVLRRKAKRLSPAAQAFKEFVLNQAVQFIRLPE